MDPAFLGPLVPIAAIIAFAAVKIARLRATPPASLPADVTARDCRSSLADSQGRRTPPPGGTARNQILSGPCP